MLIKPGKSANKKVLRYKEKLSNKWHAVVFSDDAVFCPECNSDHVIQLAGQTAPSTSTPVPCSFGQNGDRCFKFDYIDTQKVYVASVTNFINPLIHYSFISFTAFIICRIHYFSSSYSVHCLVLDVPLIQVISFHLFICVVVNIYNP